ncbi:pyruvate kinase [Thermodesulfobacteriota bacterium]
MKLPASKTKIVCTIGPASESPELLEKMIQAGMDVARLNFSHGDFSGHREVIQNIRTAERALGRRVAIMADLPGPKMRIGQFKKEPVMLKPGNSFLLTTEKVLGDQYRVSSGFTQLPQVVKPGDRLFLKDGLIQLIVEKVEGNDVHCQIRVGGELRSRKGLNFPGINLGISAFTNRDRECLQFALDQGVDAVSQSFVETAADIEAVFDAASAMGHRPFVIAKIERAGALDHIDGILQVADGIMIARGDLGVEIPIEQIAVVQKRLMIQANLLGKPVITATQMLESMTNSRLPTRAEATDVANAVLDGTDCVMLSGESAMGRYPLESVKMLVKIAAAIEVHRPKYRMQEILKAEGKDSSLRLSDLIALSVQSTLDRVSPAAVIVPTRSGYTARNVARFKLPVWVTAVSAEERTCQGLQFSYGVYPMHEPEHPGDWRAFAREWLKSHDVEGHLVVLTEGPSQRHPDRNNRMELIDLRRKDKPS